MRGEISKYPPNFFENRSNNFLVSVYFYSYKNVGAIDKQLVSAKYPKIYFNKILHPGTFRF